MSHFHRSVSRLVVAFLVCLGTGPGGLARAAQTPPDITLLVPGGSGGGWDLTARSMKATLESEGLARVRIEMSPGPGGSVGLAQLLSGHRGDGRTLLVGGLVMLSASASQRLAISPLDATPIARLTGDHPVLLVPNSSPFTTVTGLMDAVKGQTSAFPWAGGSSGSLYERLAGDIYESAGISRSAVNYVPYGGGREVAESLLTGRARVGLSELAEIAPYLARGELRALAVASPSRLTGIDAPTLRESGFDVSAVNWRGVFAGPGLGNADRQALDTLVARMVESPNWKAALGERRWSDLYLTGPSFREFLEAEYAAWSAPPRSRELPAVDTRPRPTPPPARTLVTWLAGLGAVAMLAFWFALHRRSPIVDTPPPPSLPVATDPDSGPDVTALQEAIGDADDEVARAFDAWKLTPAEREIAELMLQGLRYKQIAGKRGTSERTVRQQAQIILKKAGLDGRSDLAALFLHRRGA